ncbi:MAG TPA: TetR/AcrR family transcriptional regulator [Polyangiaceae bacterium]|nr:TetR/AcrR family transcriptional regulator [Polyangiaceae bacterium]
MPGKTNHKGAPPPRRRRTALEARTAILDAAERRLVESGPAAIRLQEVAKDVGVSHPTVLHHFGSREGLVEAVVHRALDSVQAELLEAVRSSRDSPNEAEVLLESVFDALARRGHARAFLWLVLSGYASDVEALRVRAVAEAVHEARRQRRAGKKRMPPFEDTYFTVLLPALALLSLSIAGGLMGVGDDESAPLGPRRFRAWLGRLIHEHLEHG